MLFLMFSWQKPSMTVALACGIVACGVVGCGVPGGQEPAQEPVPATAQPQPNQEQAHQHEPVAWGSQPSSTPVHRPNAHVPQPVAPPVTTPPVTSPPVTSPPRPPVATTPPRPAPATSQLSSQNQEILDAHNKFRARHCAQPLSWSANLEAVAQDWADQLAAANCAFEHRQPNRFGENLTFFAPVGSQSPAGVATGWYSEVQQYDFGNGQFDFQTGHFTQVVWTSTTELGCGVSQCNGGEIWVCNYNPPGNMMGDFKRRVLHPNQCVSSAR